MYINWELHSVINPFGSAYTILGFLPTFMLLDFQSFKGSMPKKKTKKQEVNQAAVHLSPHKT